MGQQPSNKRNEPMPIVTLEQFEQIFPNVQNKETWYNAFIRAIEHFGFQQRIDELPLFFAQVYHESNGLTVLKEDLYYSAPRLMQVWPSRFPTLEIAKQYAMNPTKLANRVYANRMGNGDESSGDGYKYSGKGPIQITGKYQYDKLCIDNMCSPIETNTQLLIRNPLYGALSAVWYYNTYVPIGSDIKASTKAINGGYTGLTYREQQYERIKGILNK